MLSGVQLHYVDSFEECENFMRWLSEDAQREWLAVDLETQGFEWFRQRVRLAQFGDLRDGWAIPYDRWAGLIAEVFKRVRGVRFVAHNAKFDSEWLIHNGFGPLPTIDDSMVMAYLVQPDRAKGLKAAAARWVDPRAMRGDQALKVAMQKARWDWSTVPVDFPLYWMYGALDTVLTAHLANTLWPQVVENGWKGAYDLEMTAIDVLLEMEMRGIKIDVDYCVQQRAILDAELDQLIEQIPVDPFSPAQLVRYFWDQGVELKLTTEGGGPSVKKEALEEIDLPVAPLVLRARHCQKMSETYFGNLLEYAQGDTLHPNINPLGAVTSRMSVTRPALQTLPRTALIRNAFVPSPGNKLVLADYQGQELRVFAHFCQDPNMLKAYREGQDLHEVLAEAIFGVGFTKEQRRIAKSANFTDIYGAGDDKFAKVTGLLLADARHIKARRRALFPQADRFKARVAQTIVQRARDARSQSGWVTTISGIRLPVARDKAYKGVNYLIQGSCAAITKRAIVDLDAAGLGEYLVLPVHDELAFDVPADLAEEVAREAARIMAQAAPEISVPMVVEPDVVDRWGVKYEEAA